jgi:predicted enzyme related to lactoylglutathione lyase
LDDLRSFYGLLGIEMKEERHGKGPVHFAGRVGDAVLEIYPLSSNDTPVDTTTRLGFAINDLTSTVQAVRVSGHAVVTEPQATEWGIRAVVRDPDGRSVELFQR